MKRLLLLTVLSLLAVKTTMQAEEPDPLSFFPHQVGDTWIRQYYHGTKTALIITKDSVDNSGYKYLFYNGSNEVYFYIKQTDVFAFDELRYKLTAQKDEIWTVRPANIEKGDPRIEAHVDNVYETILFGRWTTVKQISYFFLYNGDTTIDGNNAVYGYTQWLASGIGLVQELLEGSSEMEFVLTGCIINGDTLGIVTGVPEAGGLASFSVHAFPNPCTALTTIRCTSPEDITRGHIELVDMFGRTVYSAEIQTNTHTINTSAFADGIYFCRVTVGTHTAMQGIVVRR